MDSGCGIGGACTFKLLVNKISRGGSEVITLECSPQDIVQDVCERAEATFESELRYKGEFENQPKDLTLLDVGMSQDMEVDLMITCFPRAEAECGIGGAGAFKLTISKLAKGSVEVIVLECSPKDIVQDVCDRAEATFESELRHRGTLENQPKDLTLLDVGISQDMEVDLMVTCFPRGAPPNG